jgi:glyoxylase-like metal-dependent hydrolase (beta-lactamase superfamily II)
MRKFHRLGQYGVEFVPPPLSSSLLIEAPYVNRGRNLREIDFEGPGSLAIGQFRAFDYFGDASFFLLDSPGHAVGHLCGLVRTTADTFVLLGGDVCHYAGIFRPSRYMPVPSSITPHPLQPTSDLPFCPGHAFEELQRSRKRSSQDPLYTPTFGHDIPLAIRTIEKLQEADANENVFVIIAHDSTVGDVVDHFPKSLNGWKEKGWGKKTRWAFFRDLKPYFTTCGVA